MKLPTLKEIDKAQHDLCASDCDECPVTLYAKNIGEENWNCGVTIFHAILSGKLTLEGKPVVDEEAEKEAQEC